MSHWKQNATFVCAASPAVFRMQAPGLVGEPLSPGAALDAVMSLARRNGEAPCLSAAAMHCMMVEPILAGTYVLISMQQASGAWQAVGWLAYALFDADAESRYVANPARFIQPTDWNRGDRLWMLHWIAEPGHTRRLLPVARQLFGHLTARGLHRHGRDRLTTWRGAGCSSQEATAFWQRRPVLSARGADHTAAPLLKQKMSGACSWAT